MKDSQGHICMSCASDQDRQSIDNAAASRQELPPARRSAIIGGLRHIIRLIMCIPIFADVHRAGDI